MTKTKTKRVVVWAVFAFCALVRGAAAQGPTTGPCETHLKRWREISVIVPEWKFSAFGDFRGEATELSDAGWQAAKSGQRLGTDAAWLRAVIEAPASRSGYALAGAKLELETSVYVHWQSRDMPVFRTVFVNGVQRAAGYEFEPVVLAEAAAPGQKFVIAMRAQTSAGNLILGDARVRVTEVRGRPNAQTHFEELTAAEILHRGATDANAERGSAIEAACAAVDWAALGRDDQAGFDRSLAAARGKIEPLREWLKSYEITAAGNSHIDMAWLWPWTETVEVVRNTFASALTLMQEFPEFKFSHSSVATYWWMEDKYPELFNAIRRRAKEGRWEFVGGMWVEPDLNMPDGESLVRQLLVGKRYMKEKFGADIRIGYNPDSFGYNWQLPQIYKKAGIDYFVTQKMAWNDTTKHPHKLFWWESPDGSRVLTFFPHDYVNSMDPVRMARDAADYAKQTGQPRLLHLYGVGDHGGGPTRHMLETGRRWQARDALFPSIRMSFIQDFFTAIEPFAASGKVPVWKSELYFQYHRGVQTTQAETKKNNRRSETAMLSAEKLSALAWLEGGAYDNKSFESVWRKLLFNQFHDILPGSGIDVVYRDAARDHAEIQRFAVEQQNDALAALSLQMNTSGRGVPIVVFNPLAWPRSGLVELDVPLNSANVAVVESASGGARVRVQLADLVGARKIPRGLRIRFLARDIPAFGLKVFHAEETKVKSSIPEQRGQVRSIENELVRVEVHDRTGCITSLFDKRNRRETLGTGACGNQLQAFRDKPKDWEAWNIDADFEKERWDISHPEEVILLEAGPTRPVIRVRYKWRASTFVQDISVTPDSPRVDVRMSVDWHEEQTLLKVAFPVAAKSDTATFEIPYGTIARPTTRRTPEEQAQFEVPALRWADLSDASGGLSLLNDSKYGYDAKGNVLRLTLLRSPKWPDPQADRGHHEFTYSLLPHAGDWREAQTMRHGYELNTPLVAQVAHPHSGPWGASHSFLKVSADNVVVTAVKKAEDSDELIVRFHEFAGRAGAVTLEFDRNVSAASETNLLEADEKALGIKGNVVTVPTSPYEIKTVKIRFAAAPQPTQR